MTDSVSAHSIFQKELADRGIDESVGVFRKHKIAIGLQKAIHIDEIKSAKIPFAGFKTATKIARGKAGLEQSADEVLKSLAVGSDTFKAKKLLGNIKAHLIHYDRLDKLGQLSPSQKEDLAWSFAKSVKKLTNKQLSNVFQSFNSAQMDLLQSSLNFEGRNNKKAVDARRADTSLFELQALILQEISNRSINAQIEKLEQQGNLEEKINEPVKKDITQKFGVEAPKNSNQDNHDIAAVNLMSLTEISSSSATLREKEAKLSQKKLQARKIDEVSLKEMGDVLRQSELTINVKTQYLMSGANSIFDHPNDPLVNIFSLKEQGINSKGDGYIAARDQAEKVLFPELEGDDAKGSERPVYGAINYSGRKAGAAASDDYGFSVIVLKPEVAKRATYQLNDSFISTPFTCDDKRLETFYKLLAASDKVPQKLKDVLLNPDSNERKSFEAKLYKLVDVNQNTFINLDVTKFPELIDYFGNGKEYLLDNHQVDEQNQFDAIMFQAFGDKNATRKAMATYDNVETLVSKLDDVNANMLAEASIRNKNGEDPHFCFRGVNYIEAQLQGPIVPSRDIAEIRFELDDIPEDEREGFIAKCKKYEKDTGIKVTFNDENTARYDDALSSSKLDEQAEFNQAHTDKEQVNKLRNEYLNNFHDRVKKYVDESMNNLDFPKEFLNIDGPALNKMATKFYSTVESALNHPHFHSADTLVDNDFRDSILPMLKKKAELLSEMNKLPMNDAQKKIFAHWICTAKKLDSVEELKLLYQQAVAHADLVREIISENPPKSEDELLQLMTNFVKNSYKDLGAYFAKVEKNGEEVGPDDINAEFNRISFLSLDLLKYGNPQMTEDEVKKLHEALNTSTIQNLYSRLDTIHDNYITIEIPDNVGIEKVKMMFSLNAENSAEMAGVKYRAPAPFAGQIALIPNSTRDILSQIAPNTIKVINERYPAYTPIANPSAPDAMPQNDHQRRDFCVNVMDGYLRLEQGAEKGKSTHGRGHIARAFIFADVMSNILTKKLGIKVDKNAVLCGIAGHDLGREMGGDDKWEKESSKLTVDAMKSQYGENSLGQDYADDIDGCINSKSTHNNTVEAMLLKSADSLDIGRVLEFNPEFFQFLKDKDGTVPNKEAEQIRAELAKEAELLQKMTDPLKLNKPHLDQLEKLALDAPSEQMTKFYQDQKDDVLAGITKVLELDWSLTSEQYLKRVENIIRNNPQMFPILNEFYSADKSEEELNAA